MAAQTTPKGMSSRLLTMKFMQRAAASSSPASNASTPIADESSSKRRKISHTRPAKDEVDYTVDRKAIQAAIDEDERKREDALVKRAAELGDARWVLTVQNTSDPSAEVRKPLQVVQVGYAQIDSLGAPADMEDSDDDGFQAVPIRRYNMGKKKGATEASESDNDDSSSSDNDSDLSDASSSENEGDSASHTPSAKKIDSGRRNDYARRTSAEQLRAREFADKRRKKDVKLNRSKPQSTGGLSSGDGMLSLSSGGRPMQRQTGAFSFSCHNCGEVGHKSIDCKKAKNRSR